MQPDGTYEDPRQDDTDGLTVVTPQAPQGASSADNPKTGPAFGAAPIAYNVTDQPPAEPETFDENVNPDDEAAADFDADETDEDDTEGGEEVPV